MMRYSAKEEALVEEIHVLTKWCEQLFQSGKGSDHATSLFVKRMEERIEKCIAELAALRGEGSGEEFREWMDRSD